MFRTQNKTLRNRRISLSTVLAVIAASLLAPFAVMQTAQAAVASQIVIHYPGTPRVVPGSTLNVAIDTATAAETAFVAGDDYGAFATVATSTTSKKATIDGKEWDIRVSREIWLDSLGNPHASRAQAQGFVIVHIRDSAGGAGAASLSVVDIEEDTTTTYSNLEAGSTSTEAIINIPVTELSRKLDFTVKLNNVAGITGSIDSTKWGAVWVSDEFTEIRTSESWADGYATFHYKRPSADYGTFDTNTMRCTDAAGCWGMHVWTGSSPTLSVSWAAPFQRTSTDSWGVVYRVPLADDATAMNFLFHKGDTKDPSGGGGKDQSLDLAATGGEVWYSSEQYDDAGKAIYAVPVIKSVDADLTLLKAIWMTKSTIAWPESIRTVADNAAGIHAKLLFSATGDIDVVEDAETKELVASGYDTSYSLTSGSSLDTALTTKYKHLYSYRSLTLPQAAIDNFDNLIRGQVAVLITNNTVNADTNPEGLDKLVRLTGVQLAPVLDAVYSPTAASNELGVSWNGSIPTLSVWAPTAISVSVNLYPDATTEEVLNWEMVRNAQTGVWSFDGDEFHKGFYYTYSVETYTHYKTSVLTNEVTDPYSVSLSMNSLRSQIFDPTDSAYWPEGMTPSSTRPDFTTMKDATLYELHVRDFSAIDQTVSSANRGKYLAFTETESNGMKQLKALSDAGLSHLHLLPVFDIATIEEDASLWESPGDLSGMAPDSEEQQAAIAGISDKDGFNWGYDPYHFSAPEGSYAVEVDGASRILEFRKMIKSLSDIGLRNVMDVVYNHTSASGQNGKSTFDKIVPGYYYRLANDGSVTTSTCCQNTATENAMMAKFTRESILSWVKYFKIDGFRFDLMGHMPKALLLQIRADLNALTLANDGVDGKSIILYGEGWNFGEVANDARFIQATQGNMANTGVAVYDDRMRDLAKGGGPFDTNPGIQGFVSGAWTNWNKDPDNGREAIERLGSVLSSADMVKLGMAGMLKSFSFIGADGYKTSGTLKQYQGKAAGYNTNPTDMIAYVDKHDNEALFDWLTYKLPSDATKAQRLRYQVIGMGIPTLGQGVPFWQAGSDIMRSKSLDKNSYNSGDWFNAIDWSMTDNGFGHGLPMKGDNGSRWEEFAQPLLENAEAIKPTTADMMASTLRFQDFLKVRYSSPLFRLGTGKEVQARVKSVTASGATPGVLAIQYLDGTAKIKSLKDLDKKYRSVVIVVNMNKTTRAVTFARDTTKAALHPILKAGNDSTVKKSTIKATTKKVGKVVKKNWTASVPALTIAVFVIS